MAEEDIHHLLIAIVVTMGEVAVVVVVSPGVQTIEVHILSGSLDIC